VFQLNGPSFAAVSPPSEIGDSEMLSVPAYSSGVDTAAMLAVPVLAPHSSSSTVLAGADHLADAKPT